MSTLSAASAVPLADLVTHAEARDASWAARFRNLQEKNPQHQNGYFLFLLARHEDPVAFIAHLQSRITEVPALAKNKHGTLEQSVMERLGKGDGNYMWEREHITANLVVALDLVKTLQEFGYAIPFNTNQDYELMSIGLAVIFRDQNGGSQAPRATAPKPDAPKPDAPKPDAPKPDAPKPDAPKPTPPTTDSGTKVKLAPAHVARFEALSEKLSPQRPALLTAMAKLGDDSRSMATAIIRAANKKPDDTNIRLVTTGLASYARDGKPVARSSTARGDVSWYLETLAGIEKTTVETLLAPTGPAQPAAPSAAAEPPVKQAKTPKA